METPAGTSQRWAAVVLAGGRARRLGGADKPALVVDRVSLLDGVLSACSGAAPLVVVGRRRPVAAAVRWVRERPIHGGPLAALAAGLAVVPDSASYLAVLAADLPWLRATTIRRLLSAAETGHGGAVLADQDGRPQWLAGVWHTGALRAAVDAAGDPAGRPVRTVLAGLRPALVPAVRGEAEDVDTPEQLAAARRLAAGPTDRRRSSRR